MRRYNNATRRYFVNTFRKWIDTNFERSSILDNTSSRTVVYDGGGDGDGERGSKMFRVAAAAPPNVNPTLLFWMLTAADGRVPEGIIAPEEIYGIVSIAYAVVYTGHSSKDDGKKNGRWTRALFE